MDTDVFFKVFKFLALIFSVIIHEISHAYAALKCGDPTARDQGRITLNPIPHIDPIMTIALPLILTLSGSPLIFGGAKPVPVNIRRCYNPRKAYWITAIAGPLSNLAQAAIALVGMLVATIFYMKTGGGATAELVIDCFVLYGVINIFLMTFNLIPIPPLDGSRIVTVLLPDKIAWHYASIERYGFFILVALLWTGVFDSYFELVLKGYWGLYTKIVGLFY